MGPPSSSLQAIQLNIETLRTLRGDESAAYISLFRTSDGDPGVSVRVADGDDLRSIAPESRWTATTICLRNLIDDTSE
jgi:hypothetical protein